VQNHNVDPQVRAQYNAQFVNSTIGSAQIYQAQTAYLQTAAAYRQYQSDMDQYHRYIDAVGQKKASIRASVKGMNDQQLNQAMRPIIQQGKQYLDKALASYNQYSASADQLESRLNQMNGQVNQALRGLSASGNSYVKSVKPEEFSKALVSVVSNGAKPSETGVKVFLDGNSKIAINKGRFIK
jgi:exonuclease VII small subunit